MKALILTVLVLLTGLAYGQDSSTNGDYIMLVDPLDEPEFYCFDLAGWGESLQLDDPLQTHTCKARSAADQMFHFEGGRLRASEYDLCLQVAGSGGTTLAGSAVLVRACSGDNAFQEIILDEDGRLRVMGSNFCLAAGEESVPANGPSHLWRTLTVQSCEGLEPSLATWQVGLD